MAPINCGSELARDSGGSVNISSNCLTAIASKLTPTMDGDRLAGAGGATGSGVVFPETWLLEKEGRKDRLEKVYGTIS